MSEEKWEIARLFETIPKADGDTRLHIVLKSTQGRRCEIVVPGVYSLSGGEKAMTLAGFRY